MPAISQLNGGILKPIPSDTDLLPVQEAGGSTVPISVLSLQNKVLQASAGIGGQAAWQVKNTNYTAVPGDRLAVDASAGIVTITLPAIPSAVAADIWIQKTDLSANPVRINPGTNRIRNLPGFIGELRGVGTTETFNYVGGLTGWISQGNRLNYTNGVTDPLFANVSLLMPLDMATGINDLKGKSVTNINNRIALSTAINNPFGINSGVAQVPTSYRAIIGNPGDFTFANNAFAIEMWLFPVLFPSAPTGLNGTWGLLDVRDSPTAQPFALNGLPNGKLSFYQVVDGSLSTSNSLVLNQWNYVCVSRNASGDTLRIWINGVLGLTFPTRQTNMTASGRLFIGDDVDNNPGLNGTFIGYMSNVRITNAFRNGAVVPTQAFPTS